MRCVTLNWGLLAPHREQGQVAEERLTQQWEDDLPEVSRLPSLWKGA